MIDQAIKPPHCQQRRRTQEQKDAAERTALASAQAVLCAIRRDDPGEFCPFDVDGPERRNDNEHPESAYRRGFQQGAHEVTSALIKAGLLNEKTVSVFNRQVANWRFGKRKLKRELGRDAAPKLTLK